jgi:hypothetical protein
LAAQLFSKFIRPETPRPGPITERDLDLLDAIRRYRFSPAAELVRLVGGNEDVTFRRLRLLWERGLISRWAFPGIRTHSQFHYYLDSRQGLKLLAERRGLVIHPQMLEEIRGNREKDYGGAALRGQHMQLGFLNHSLMISRMHLMVELACRNSAGVLSLETWSQGGRLAGHKVDVPRIRSTKQGGDLFWEESAETERLPVEPDAVFTIRVRAEGSERLAHFCYEADRGSMTVTDMLRKFRGYYHFIKHQRRHQEAFGIHPVRAVLVETTDEARGRRLMELANHPLVCGSQKGTGLFWFTISPLFEDAAPGTTIPHYLNRPQVVLDKVWATPDQRLHSLIDGENAPLPVAAPRPSQSS